MEILKVGGKDIKCPFCGETLYLECIDQNDTNYDLYKTKNNKFRTRLVYACGNEQCEHEEAFTVYVHGTLDISKVEYEIN